jgi:hypothetical protein
MSRTSMFALGALGGILPILANILTVDVAPFIDGEHSLTLGNYIGYGIRVIVLIILGGVMASLNSEVRSPIALVQLGIAAPALITSYINGASPTTSPNTAGIEFSIMSPAYADALDTENSFMLAGGFWTDVGRGFGNRLDRLGGAYGSAPEAAPAPDAVSPPTPSPQQDQLPQAGWGTYCLTPNGRFGPGPIIPLGTPCQVPTSDGFVTGTIGR